MSAKIAAFARRLRGGDGLPAECGKWITPGPQATSFFPGCELDNFGSCAAKAE
jgi:hypothetical protein